MHGSSSHTPMTRQVPPRDFAPVSAAWSPARANRILLTAALVIVGCQTANPRDAAVLDVTATDVPYADFLRVGKATHQKCITLFCEDQWDQLATEGRRLQVLGHHWKELAPSDVKDKKRFAELTAALEAHAVSLQK